MSDEYTPTTDEVRDAYDLHRLRSKESKDGDEEFDRWLAERDADLLRRQNKAFELLKAAIWSQAYVAGARYVISGAKEHPKNPYEATNG